MLINELLKVLISPIFKSAGSEKVDFLPALHIPAFVGGLKAIGTCTATVEAMDTLIMFD